MQNIRAEVALPTSDLTGDIGFFTKTLGFRMEEIYPADDPRVVLLAGYSLRLRLDRTMSGAGHVRLMCDDPVLIADGQTQLVSPGGVQVEIAPLAPPVETPVPTEEFVVRRMADKAPWVVGRAGMQYRDLIPSRLGGSIIASHIRIPDGGPVPDMVHYHSVGFQLIFCYRGWVDLVYEGQGEPFRLHAGNCVIQPPEIRHRVLYASDNIEVVEIGVPAEHTTTIDHSMELPTPNYTPDRAFDGQTFVHFKANTSWDAKTVSGFKAQDTGVQANTKGVASVKVLQPDGTSGGAFTPTDGIYFGFVMDGQMSLQAAGQPTQTLTAGDAFVLPPDAEAQFNAPTSDLRLLEVTLPKP